MANGLIGPKGLTGPVGRPGLDPEQYRIMILRIDLDYKLWCLGTIEKITEEEFDKITEMIHSSDLDNLGVAEAIITQLSL